LITEEISSKISAMNVLVTGGAGYIGSGTFPAAGKEEAFKALDTGNDASVTVSHLSDPVPRQSGFPSPAAYFPCAEAWGPDFNLHPARR